MIQNLERQSHTVGFHVGVAITFVIINIFGYLYVGGLGFVQGWGGGIAAVIATYFLVFKSQGYWAWMIVNAGLWTYLFFHLDLPMLAWLQVSILIFSIYGSIQWMLVKVGIGFRFDRRSDVIGAILASLLFSYSVFAYIGMDGYAWTTWWALEFASVAFAILAMWMDAYKYKANWIMWTLSNCCSAPLFFHLASWGPFYTIFAYQALNVFGYIIWRNAEKKEIAAEREKLIPEGGTFEHAALVTGHV